VSDTNKTKGKGETEMKAKAENVAKELYLSSSLEFAVEDIYRGLFTAIDLSIALEREERRLDRLAQDTHELELDELRVPTALLASIAREAEALRNNCISLMERFETVLIDNGLNPIVPESWCRSNSQTIRALRLKRRTGKVTAPTKDQEES
jgi:hypothetical protein